MSRCKKPRKLYKPKPISAETMTLAKHFAAKPSANDRAEVLGLLRTAITALRQGVATEHQWSVVAGSVSVALAIEARGIVRGLSEHFHTAELALQNIYTRALEKGNGHWHRVTLYASELTALDTLFDLHKFQVDQLGRAEFLAAIDAAQKQNIKQGHTVTRAQTPIDHLASQALSNQKTHGEHA